MVRVKVEEKELEENGRKEETRRDEGEYRGEMKGQKRGAKSTHKQETQPHTCKRMRGAKINCKFCSAGRTSLIFHLHTWALWQCQGSAKADLSIYYPRGNSTELDALSP